jgi:predicted Zn-dependent peptidase
VQILWNLGGGARLVVEEIPYVKSAALGVFIGVGSRHEPHSLSGASHFIEHMLFKGTEDRSARDIADLFEGMGGQLNAYTGRENTCVYARTLDEDLYTAMDTIFDMVFHSRLAERDFETEKGVVVEEINMYEDTPDDLIHDIFAQQLWLGHGLGQPTLGTLETVEGFSRDDLYGYYRYGYVPSNMVIAVAGNVKADEVREEVERHLVRVPSGQPEFKLTAPQQSERFLYLLPKETEQVQICMGVPGISFHDPRRFAQNIMNSILGGGISSRLFQAIREEMGLAYSIYSYPSNFSDSGSYVIYVGTSPGKLESFFQVLKRELDQFINVGISEEELVRTQKLIKSSLYLGMESVMNRMNRLGKSVLMYNQVTPLEEIIEKIMAVNTGTIQELARELLSPQRFSLAAIGSPDVLEDVKKQYSQSWV